MLLSTRKKARQDGKNQVAILTVPTGRPEKRDSYCPRRRASVGSWGCFSVASDELWELMVEEIQIGTYVVRFTQPDLQATLQCSRAGRLGEMPG